MDKNDKSLLWVVALSVLVIIAVLYVLWIKAWLHQKPPRPEPIDTPPPVVVIPEEQATE